MTAAVAGIWLSIPLSIFGLLVMIGGFAAFAMTAARAQQPEETASPYQAEITRLELELTRKKQEWQNFLNTLELPGEILPESFTAVVKTILQVKDLQQQLQEAQTEHSTLQIAMQEIKSAHDALLPLLPNPSDDLTANCELLAQGLAQQEEADRQLRELAAQQQELTMELHEAEHKLDTAQTAMQELFAVCQSPDETAMRQNIDLDRQRRELLRQQEMLLLRLRQQLGMQFDIDGYVRELSAADPAVMAEEIRELEELLAQHKNLLAEKNEAIGQLKNEIRIMSTQDELAKLRNQEESLKQQMRDAALRWATDRIALRMIERATAKYERDRQPGVIRHATELFQSITAGRYNSIYKSLENNQLYLRESHSGRSCQVKELSRGTREELYLAMRLGLIAEYEQRGEPMPLILDDIMVNFDDARASRALNALAEFAAPRQAVILTCHRHFLDLCLKAGAHRIEP